MKAHALTAAEVGGPAKRKPATPTYPARWIRLPTRGHCPDTGLSRPAFYQLIAAGRIRSACIRQPGAIRGQRLVFLPSVMALLDAAAEAEAKRLAPTSGEHSDQHAG
jgi:hypothetical protein